MFFEIYYCSFANRSLIDLTTIEKDLVTCMSAFRKEVIQPQVPLVLPCYDFTPVMDHTVVNAIPKVKLSTSGAMHSHGVTGGVYRPENVFTAAC